MDCSGRNHIVKDFAPRTGDFRWYSSGGFHLETDVQMEFEDGRYSCGCGSSPEPAISREEIEEAWKSLSKEYIEDQRRLGWWTERNDKIHSCLMNGGHYVDERGVLLPEWEKE